MSLTFWILFGLSGWLACAGSRLELWAERRKVYKLKLTLNELYGKFGVTYYSAYPKELVEQWKNEKDSLN